MTVEIDAHIVFEHGLHGMNHGYSVAHHRLLPARCRVRDSTR
jgi:hypothetical protein